MDKFYICIFLTICNFVYNWGEYCENCLENCCCEYFNCFGKDNSNQNNQDYANESQLFKEIFPKYEGKIIDINAAENKKYLIYDILNSIYEKYNKKSVSTNNFKEENYEIEENEESEENYEIEENEEIKLKNKNVKIIKLKGEVVFFIEIGNLNFEINLFFTKDLEKEKEFYEKNVFAPFFHNEFIRERYLAFCFKDCIGSCTETFRRDIYTQLFAVKFSQEAFNRLALNMLKLQKLLIEKNIYFYNLEFFSIFLKKNNEGGYVWKMSNMPCHIPSDEKFILRLKNNFSKVFPYSCFNQLLLENSENLKIRLLNETLFSFAVILYVFKNSTFLKFTDSQEDRIKVFNEYCKDIKENDDTPIYDRIFLKFRDGINNEKINCEYINVDDLIEELKKSLENSPSVMN